MLTNISRTINNSGLKSALNRAGVSVKFCGSPETENKDNGKEEVSLPG